MAWTFDAELWRHESFPAWAFIALPEDVSDAVSVLGGPPRGFGAVKVEVGVGASTWQTSVFPDPARGYVMPVKAAVRRAERLTLGDTVEVRLRLV